MKRSSRYLIGWFEDMKFKLVESIDDRLVEASREITKAFSNKILQTSNPSGAKKLNNKIIIAHGLPILKTNNYYVLHHRNGNHNDNSKGNVWIIPNTCHSRIHEIIRNKLEEILNPSSNQKLELDYVASVMQINTFIKRLNNLKNQIEDIADKDIIFQAPPIENDFIKEYKNLQNSTREVVNQINTAVFDDYFKQHDQIKIAEFDPDLGK